MLEQMLESFLASEHGRGATETLQQQGVPQGTIRQIISEALAAHNGGSPQATSGVAGAVMPFITRFVQQHLGGGPQTPAQQATTPQGQAKFDANVANKGMAKGTTPEGQAKLDANRKAKGVGVAPFEKQADYAQKPQGFGKSFPQK